MTAPGLTVICVHTPGRAGFPLALPPARGCAVPHARGVWSGRSAGDGPRVRTLHGGLFASSVSLKALPARR